MVRNSPLPRRPVWQLVYRLPEQKVECVRMKINQFINFASRDIDRSIYRIVSCERFLQILRDRENGLVRPRLWDDPFENFILNCVAVTPDGARTKIRFRDQLYGQCW